MKNSNAVISFILIALITLGISACDGGIFGTGTGTETLETNFPENASVQSPTADNTSDAQLIAHENFTVGTSSNFPQFNIINASDLAINAINSTNNTSLFTGSIAAEGFSNITSLSLNMNSLTIQDADSLEILIRIGSLTAGAGTLSTLIIRNNNTTEGIDGFIVNSSSVSSSPMTADVRIIQVDTLSENDMGAGFLLSPDGSNPGSSSVEFSDVSVTTGAQATYQTITPGDYRLIDSLERIPSSPLTLEGGRVYTLIIRSNTGGNLLIHEDSRFEF